MAIEAARDAFPAWSRESIGRSMHWIGSAASSSLG
jgi:hypothetical protein